ncbi:MAG: hypothetical protein QOK48_865 [Blastocatellia bacterium]|jgi:hypothetical protein|nr:hypothetical protein [Blastocatellia bacterium]
MARRHWRRQRLADVMKTCKTNFSLSLVRDKLKLAVQKLKLVAH